MSSIQLDLFDQSKTERIPEPDKPTFLEWSYSRRGVLEQCPRKYYYQYYGSSSKKSNDDPQKEKLHFLKKLQNRHLRTGSLLHLVIRTYLKKLQQGEQWSLDWLLSWARKMYWADLEYSREYENRTGIQDGDRSPTLLLEFYYDLPDAEPFCTEAGRRLITALTNFAQSQNFTQFRESACQTTTQIEKPMRLKESRFTLKGTVDIIYWEDDRVVIVDWKIGRAGNSDDSLQMLAYAWLAKQELRIPVDRIVLHRAHLADDIVSTSNFTEKDLKRVKAKILQDLEQMQAAHLFGQQWSADAFTPYAQPKVCALCQFQEVCPKE